MGLRNKFKMYGKTESHNPFINLIHYNINGRGMNIRYTKLFQNSIQSTGNNRHIVLGIKN